MFVPLNSNLTINAENYLFSQSIAQPRVFLHNRTNWILAKAAGLFQGLFLFFKAKLCPFTCQKYSLSIQKTNTEKGFRLLLIQKTSYSSERKATMPLSFSPFQETNGNKCETLLTDNFKSWKHNYTAYKQEAARHSHSQNRFQCERFGILIRPNAMLNDAPRMQNIIRCQPVPILPGSLLLGNIITVVGGALYSLRGKGYKTSPMTSPPQPLTFCL